MAATLDLAIPSRTLGIGVMNYDEIEQLRARHPAWALLSSRNVALVLSFLGRVFVVANESNIAATRLIRELDDEIYALNRRLGEATFPRPAKEYLDDWADPKRAWLRKYYPAGSDEPHDDLTPAVEKAIAWVDDLQARSFIGTESLSVVRSICSTRSASAIAISSSPA
jgi:hypothetical protein